MNVHATLETLALFDQEPVLGIYDDGMRDDFMSQPTRDGLDWGYPQYRHYIIAAFPVEDYNDELSPRNRFRDPYGNGEIRPVSDVRTTRIGVNSFRDDWKDLPSYMYPSGHIPSFLASKSERLVIDSEPRVITDTSIAHHAGVVSIDAILREQEIPTTLIVGEKTIVNFLAGYIEGCEADKPKRMPHRQTDWLLPRADADLMRLMTCAYLSGVEPENLPNPDEHRYRVMIDLADTLSWYYTQHRSTLDELIKDPSEFEDERFHRMYMELSDPLDHVQRILQDRGNNDSVDQIVAAYQIGTSELIEAVQQLWYAHNYWYEAGDEAEDLFTHFHRRPDLDWARQFIAETSPEMMKYYNDIIEQTVRCAVNVNYFGGDIAPEL